MPTTRPKPDIANESTEDRYSITLTGRMELVDAETVDEDLDDEAPTLRMATNWWVPIAVPEVELPK
jgi:hypothetical protein